jgi:low affinity Fe/Cu permease
MENRFLCAIDTAIEKTTYVASSMGGACFPLAMMIGWSIASYYVGWREAWVYVDVIATATMFIMLFLLQRSQTKHTLAMQIKLNELLAAVQHASPALINVEKRTQAEIQQLHDQFQDLAAQDPGAHSIHEALDPKVDG